MATERTFQVLLSEMARVQSVLEMLTKRCERRALPAPTWTWGKAYTRREHHAESPCNAPVCNGCRNVARVPLTLVGDPPKYAGWTFVAALTHVEGETVIRAASDVDSKYRSTGAVCDHCGHKRARSETYVVRHEDGRTMQVGSTCLGDFLGRDDAGRLAANATGYYAFYGAAEEGEEGSGNGTSSTTMLDTYLPIVAWCVRECGWVSRTAARERGGMATADQAWTFTFDFVAAEKAKCAPTAEDAALAADAEKWAESITDETLRGEKSDYLHNLRVVARAGYVTTKLAGVAASMIVAYQNFLGRERLKAERAARAPSTYVGEVGKRSTFDATLDFVTGYDTDYGFMVVCKFKTATGATLVWKSTSATLERDHVGKRYIIRGTVKAHSEYKGEKQTILSRADVADFDQIAFDAEVADARYKELMATVKAGTASDDDRAELDALKASRKAASKAKSAKVAAHMVIATEPFERHYPITHTAVKLVGRDDVWLDFDTRWECIFLSYENRSYHFTGKDALTKARKFVAELLSEAA